MTPLHGIACFYDVGFGARAVSRKTPIYFIYLFVSLQMRARIFDNWRRSLRHRIEVLARLL